MQSLWTFSAFLRVIEEEFDVTVDPDVAATVTTVGQALELIKNAVEGA